MFTQHLMSNRVELASNWGDCKREQDGLARQPANWRVSQSIKQTMWQANGSQWGMAVCVCVCCAPLCGYLFQFRSSPNRWRHGLSNRDTYLSYIHIHNDIAEYYIHHIMHKQHVLYVSHSSTFDYLKRITNPIEIYFILALFFLLLSSVYARFFGTFIGYLYLWVQRGKPIHTHTHTERTAHLLRILPINCYNIFHHIYL